MVDRKLPMGRTFRLGIIALSVLLLAPVLGWAAPCDVVEGPPGTISLPPDGCGYLSPDDVHMIIDGLPIGTTIEVGLEHKAFFCGGQGVPAPPCSIAVPAGFCEAGGGSLAGTVECFYSEAELTLTGTGVLGSFNRVITVPVTTELHSGPRTPGDPFQSFNSEMITLDGQLFGDPDFAQIQIVAGSNHGLPSPGQVALTDNGNGTYSVDSFFDVSYEISFVGAPGGQLDGMAGTTQGQVTMGVGSLLPVPSASLYGWMLLSVLVLGTAAVMLRRNAKAERT